MHRVRINYLSGMPLGPRGRGLLTWAVAIQQAIVSKWMWDNRDRVQLILPTGGERWLR